MVVYKDVVQLRFKNKTNIWMLKSLAGSDGAFLNISPAGSTYLQKLLKQSGGNKQKKHDIDDNRST